MKKLPNLLQYFGTSNDKYNYKLPPPNENSKYKAFQCLHMKNKPFIIYFYSILSFLITLKPIFFGHFPLRKQTQKLVIKLWNYPIT